MALGLVLGGLAVWRWLASGAPTGGDGAQYLAHALALLEGRPYEDTGYLYTPAIWTVGPLRYPPGLPVTLTPFLAVFGPFSSAPLVLMHIFLLAFAALAGLYCAREDGPAVGWGVAGLVAAAMLLGDHANVVGSDLGFCALVWGVLVLADAPGRSSWKRSGGMAVLGFGALAYRLAAAPLVPALAVFAVLRRRRFGWSGAVIAVLWAAVLYVILQNFGLSDTASPGGAGAGLGGNTPPSALDRWLGAAGHRFGTYQDGLSKALLYPSPLAAANRVYHVCALAIAVIGIWPWVRRKATSFGVLFAAGTAAMLLISPVWQPRYLWVLFPFVGFGLLRGVVAIVAAVESRFARRWTVPRPGLALPSSLALICLAVAAAILEPPSTHPPELQTWRAVDSALAGLEAGDPLRVASNRPRKVAWFTGVPAMPVALRHLDRFLSEAEARAIRLVVFTTAVDDRIQLDIWENWLSDYPDLFAPRGEVGPVQIFELTRYSR